MEIENVIGDVSKETMELIRNRLRDTPIKGTTPPMRRVIARFERDIDGV